MKEDINLPQDNILEKTQEERIKEYAKRFTNVSLSAKEAEELVKNIFITEQKARLNDEIKQNSEKKSKISRENLVQMFAEYKKYSILEIHDSCNMEEEIEEFVKNNKIFFKQGMNIFFIESWKEHPSVAVVIIDDINNINFNEDSIDIYSIPGDSDILVRFNMEHNFVTPDKIKK